MPPDYLVGTGSQTGWMLTARYKAPVAPKKTIMPRWSYPITVRTVLMVSKSELRVILDMTPADYALVAPLVCVIPQVGTCR